MISGERMRSNFSERNNQEQVDYLLNAIMKSVQRVNHALRADTQDWTSLVNTIKLIYEVVQFDAILILLDINKA